MKKKRRRWEIDQETKEWKQGKQGKEEQTKTDRNQLWEVPRGGWQRWNRAGSPSTSSPPATISFRIYRICNNIVQNMQNMQQNLSEYATISFRICNNIVQNMQNMQNMQQYRSEYATIWFRMVQNCGFVLNYLFLLNVFTHSARSPIWVFVVNEERLQRLLSFQKDIIHQNRQLLLCNKLIFIWNINVCHHIKVPSYSLQMSPNKITS